MNPFDDTFGDGEAVLDYSDGDFQIIKPGAYVTCAVTSRKIDISQLKYWNVDKQEAYIDAAAAMTGFGLENSK